MVSNAGPGSPSAFPDLTSLSSAASHDLGRGLLDHSISRSVLVRSAHVDTPVTPFPGDDGQPDLPSGGHAELPGGGQRDYLV